MASKEYKRIRRIFNLLQPKAAPPTAWDSIYVWLVDRARIVLIVAEFVIVLIFISKVFVDTQARSLDDSVKLLDDQYRSAYSGSEPRLVALQQKAKSYTEVWQKSSDYADLFTEINSYIGNSAAKITVIFTDDRLTVNGFSDQNELAAFEAAVKTSPRFTSVELFELKSDSTDSEVTTSGFGLRAQVKDKFSRAIN